MAEKPTERKKKRIKPGRTSASQEIRSSLRSEVLSTTLEPKRTVTVSAATTSAGPAAVSESQEPTPAKTFPVVGIGASAGGLEAFTSFLRALPADTGMTFVLVQHM